MRKSRSSLFVLFSVVLVMLLSSCATTQAPVDDQSVRKRARAHTDLGAAYFQQKKLSIALEEFTLASTIDPNFGFAFNGLGLVNAALGQFDAADVAFKRAIQIDPASSEARNNYGNFLCSRGRYDASIVEYLKAVENPVYSTPAAAYTNAGICSVRGKDFKNAEIYLNKALQIKPLSNTARYQLASLQHKTNRTQAAYETLSTVLLAGPSADVLYLAVKLSNQLGLKASEKDYRIQLFKQYPGSKQARTLKSEMLNN